MKMYRTDPDNNFEKWRDWHVITIAKAGGAALDVYAWGLYKVDMEVLKKFAAQVNENYSTGTLFPQAPVSSIPFRYFNFVTEYDFPLYYIDDFRRHIQEFIDLNRNQIHARKILLDFHRDSDPVWDCYLTAAEKAFKEFLNQNEVDEIALMK